MPAALFWEQIADPADFYPFSLYGSPRAAEMLRESLGFPSLAFNWIELQEAMEAREREKDRELLNYLLGIQAENKRLMRTIRAG